MISTSKSEALIYWRPPLSWASVGNKNNVSHTVQMILFPAFVGIIHLSND